MVVVPLVLLMIDWELDTQFEHLAAVLSLCLREVRELSSVAIASLRIPHCFFSFHVAEIGQPCADTDGYCSF